MTIIDGKATGAKIRAQITKDTLQFKEKYGFVPGLAVVIVGDDPASKVYVRNKKLACDEVGFYSEEYALSANTTEQELLALIDKLNNKKEIHGILVQSPLPPHLDEAIIINNILPEKDVDAFHPVNVGKIMIGDYDFVPCTPMGVMELLKEYNIDPCGKKCVVVGRSNIVGKPMAMLMVHANATVTICHSKTKELSEALKQADIIIMAIGKAKFLKDESIKQDAVIIDVGMNRDENGKLCGDCDFDLCSKKASFITPVPGGVGPMTITMLMKNTYTAAKLFAEKNS